MPTSARSPAPRLSHGSTLVILFILAVCGCATNQRLGVKLNQPTYWLSQNGERFVASYGSLSDDSLNFVQVTMPDGRHFTLAQSVSASGVRYTDDFKLVWWEHQGTVYVDVRREDGEWDKNRWELRPDARVH